MVSVVPTAQFELTDHHGRAVTAADFTGKYLLVYFGFTHCKVVCPRSLSKLTRVLEVLGAKADAVQALYVTVDPARDTPDVMQRYLEGQHPRFLGLTGTDDQIDRAKRDFRVFAEFKGDDEAPDGYVVPHSAIAYLMGPDGAYLDHFIDALDDEEVVRRMDAALSSVSRSPSTPN